MIHFQMTNQYANISGLCTRRLFIFAIKATFKNDVNIHRIWSEYDQFLNRFFAMFASRLFDILKRFFKESDRRES